MTNRAHRADFRYSQRKKKKSESHSETYFQRRELGLLGEIEASVSLVGKLDMKPTLSRISYRAQINRSQIIERNQPQG